VSFKLSLTVRSECRILKQFTPMDLRLSTLVFRRILSDLVAEWGVLAQIDERWPRIESRLVGAYLTRTQNFSQISKRFRDESKTSFERILTPLQNSITIILLLSY
jgi:hypothetical protein